MDPIFSKTKLAEGKIFVKTWFGSENLLDHNVCLEYNIDTSADVDNNIVPQL
jgi:hypothetical protein